MSDEANRLDKPSGSSHDADNMSVHSQMSSKSFKHRAKICGICLEQHSANWARHWKLKHPDDQLFEASEEQLNEAKPLPSLKRQSDPNSDKALTDTKSKRQKIDDTLSLQIINKPTPLNDYSSQAELNYDQEDYEDYDRTRPIVKEVVTKMQALDIFQIFSVWVKADTLPTLAKRKALIVSEAANFCQRNVALHFKKYYIAGFVEALQDLNVDLNLSTDKLVGIIVALLFQSIHCDSDVNLIVYLNKFFAGLKQKPDQCFLVAQRLVLVLNTMIDENVSGWIAWNPTRLNPEVVPLLRHLCGKRNLHAGFCLRFSSAVSFGENTGLKELKLYCDAIACFVEGVFGEWFSDYLDKNQVTRMEFYEYLDLLHTFGSSDFQNTAQVCQAAIQDQPLAQWTGILKAIDLSMSSDHHFAGLQEAHDQVQVYTHTTFALHTAYHELTHPINLSLLAAAHKPNKFQHALAINVAHLHQKGQRSLWEVVAGSGKSRVISCLALVLLLTHKAKKIHFVFPNQALMSRDQKEYADYFQSCWVAPVQPPVVYHCNLAFQAGADEIIIIDEADYFILEKMKEFDEKVGKSSCICFTATCTSQNSELENQLLLQLGFRRYTIGDPSAKQTAKVAEMRLRDVPSNEVLCEQIQEFRQQMPVLLFTAEDEVFNQMPDYHWLSGVVNHDELRTLDTLKTEAGYRVYGTSYESMMRGIDYRARKTGIMLIVNKSFSSFRAMAQGMSRVGRNGDHCVRAIVDHVQEVDKANVQKTQTAFT